MGGGRPSERRFTVGGSGKSVARCHRTVLAYWKFESISLQRRVSKPSVPHERLANSERGWAQRVASVSLPKPPPRQIPIDRPSTPHRPEAVHPVPAGSFLGGFRTPALITLVGHDWPASETLHR